MALQGSILLDNEEAQSVMHIQQSMRKLHQQLLKSLSLFGNLDNWDTALAYVGDIFEKEQMRSSLISIISSLISYVNGHTVSVMNMNNTGAAAGANSQNLSQILFFPSIVAPNTKSVESTKGVNDYSNMGVLLKLCAQIVEEFLVLLEERNDFKTLLVKDRYTDEEIKRFSKSEDEVYECSDLPQSLKMLSHNQHVAKIKNTIVTLLFRKDEQIQALYFVMEAVSFVLYRHLDFYFTNFDPEMFVKSHNVNFKHLRQMISSTSNFVNKSGVNVTARSESGTPNKANIGLTNSPMVADKVRPISADYSEEKIQQIKSFQVDTLHALPPVLIDRILNVDAVLNDLFSSKEAYGKEGKQPEVTSTFLSIQVKQIDRLMRNFATKLNKTQQGQTSS